MIKAIAETNNMCGIDEPNNGNKPNEATDATICGIVMAPLNRPKYVPLFLPSKAFVKNVKG